MAIVIVKKGREPNGADLVGKYVVQEGGYNFASVSRAAIVQSANPSGKVVMVQDAQRRWTGTGWEMLPGVDDVERPKPLRVTSVYAYCDTLEECGRLAAQSEANRAAYHDVLKGCRAALHKLADGAPEPQEAGEQA